MQVREAVAAAKNTFIEIFADEKIVNLGLEEVELDEPSNTWTVTLGFTRPWDTSQGPFALPAIGRPWRRDYKVIRINDATGKLVSIKNREITDAP